MNNSMMKQIFLLVFLLCSVGAFSQKVAIKNNLAYDALKTPNLSLEFSMGRKWTLDTQVGMNFFFYTKDATSSRYKTKSSATGWYSLSSVTGRVTFSTVGSSDCMHMAGR